MKTLFNVFWVIILLVVVAEVLWITVKDVERRQNKEFRAVFGLNMPTSKNRDAARPVVVKRLLDLASGYNQVLKEIDDTLKEQFVVSHKTALLPDDIIKFPALQKRVAELEIRKKACAKNFESAAMVAKSALFYDDDVLAIANLVSLQKGCGNAVDYMIE